MYKLAAMGDRDSIYGFASLGLEIFPVEDATKARSLLHRFSEEDYAVVYITEALATELSQELELFKERITPAFIPIPGVRGNTGLGLKNVSRFVEQAVGSDILP